jgi:hypothetical protein
MMVVSGGNRIASPEWERSERRGQRVGEVRFSERTMNTVSGGVEDIACAGGLGERSDASAASWSAAKTGPVPRNGAMSAEPRSEP